MCINIYLCIPHLNPVHFALHSTRLRTTSAVVCWPNVCQLSKCLYCPKVRMHCPKCMIHVCRLMLDKRTFFFLVTLCLSGCSPFSLDPRESVLERVHWRAPESTPQSASWRCGLTQRSCNYFNCQWQKTVGEMCTMSEACDSFCRKWLESP